MSNLEWWLAVNKNLKEKGKPEAACGEAREFILSPAHVDPEFAARAILALREKN